MAPLLSLIFGTLVRDFALIVLGLHNGSWSLVIATFIGFVIGLVLAGTSKYLDLPSDEMLQRGQPLGLLVGLSIAIPSGELQIILQRYKFRCLSFVSLTGIGVALSVLGNNNSSLIGVAISASLLPPSVNCGMALAFALFYCLSEFLSQTKHSVEYTSYDFLVLGGLSLTLTMINVIAIYGAALVMFRLKEVVPVVNKVAFWKDDVKLSRGLNKQQKKGLGKKMIMKKKKRSHQASFSFSGSSTNATVDYEREKIPLAHYSSNFDNTE